MIWSDRRPKNGMTKSHAEKTAWQKVMPIKRHDTEVTPNNGMTFPARLQCAVGQSNAGFRPDFCVMPFFGMTSVSCRFIGMTFVSCRFLAWLLCHAVFWRDTEVMPLKRHKVWPCGFQCPDKAYRQSSSTKIYQSFCVVSRQISCRVYPRESCNGIKK